MRQSGLWCKDQIRTALQQSVKGFSVQMQAWNRGTNEWGRAKGAWSFFSYTPNMKPWHLSASAYLNLASELMAFQINTRADWSRCVLAGLWNRAKVTKVYIRNRLSKYLIMSCLSSLNDDNIVTPIREWPQMWCSRYLLTDKSLLLFFRFVIVQAQCMRG